MLVWYVCRWSTLTLFPLFLCSHFSICLPIEKCLHSNHTIDIFFVFFFSITDAIVEEFDIQLFSSFLSSLIHIDEWDRLKMKHFPPILLLFGARYTNNKTQFNAMLQVNIC